MIIFNHRSPIDNAALLEKWLLAVKKDKFSPKKILSYAVITFWKVISVTLLRSLCQQLWRTENWDEMQFQQFLTFQHIWKNSQWRSWIQKRGYLRLHTHTHFQNVLHQRNLSLIIRMPKHNAEITKRLKKKSLIIYDLRRKNLRGEETIKGLMIRIENAKPVSKESCMALITNFGHLISQLIKNEYRNNKECLDLGMLQK